LFNDEDNVKDRVVRIYWSDRDLEGGCYDPIRTLSCNLPSGRRKAM